MLVGEVRCATTGFGIVLEIVRRQHVVGRRDEGLEEAPGAPRDQPQARAHLRRRQGSCAAWPRGERLAHKASAGAADHSTAKGRMSGHDAGDNASAPAARRQPERHAAGHLPIEAAQIQARRLRRLGGRGPLQQVAPRRTAAPGSGRSRRPCATPDRAGTRARSRSAGPPAADRRRACADACASAMSERRGRRANSGARNGGIASAARTSRTAAAAASGSGSSQHRPSAASVAGASSERRRLSSILPSRPAAPPAAGALVAEHPRQQLPVAARPAMLAFGGDVVAGRKFLDHLDVGSQSGAGEDALEQIVAEHGVVRHPAGERGLEGIDVVDALAGVGAFAEQVLVDVGDRRRIGIDAAGRRRTPLVQRAVAADRQRRRHARLQDGVAARPRAAARRRSAAGSADAPSCRSAGARRRAAGACRHRA